MVNFIFCKVEFSKMTYNNYNLIDCNKEIKAASCTASSEHSGGYGACEKANDGKLDTNWVTMAEGVGAWIQLNFENTNWIEQVEIKHRKNNYDKEMFKLVTLEFNSMAKVDYTLNSDTSHQWNVVTLFHIPNTNYLKIIAKTVYGTINNGFSEIRVTGCSVGTNYIHFH